MSLKREMLTEAGIEDKAVIDNIMQAYGAGIENAKSQAKIEMQAEADNLKEQLEMQEQTIKDLQGADGASEELKQQLADIQSQFDTYKSESESNLAKIKKTNAVELALHEVGAHNPSDLMKFIDLEKTELGEDGKPSIEDTIKVLREEKAYLFKETEAAEPKPSISTTGNPSVDNAGDNLSAEEKALFDGFDSA